MKNTPTIKIVIESIQWGVILALIIGSVWFFLKFKHHVNENSDKERYNMIYNDRKINELIQQNKMLQDSIKVLNNDTAELSNYIHISENVIK